MGKVNNSKMVKYYDVAGGDNCSCNPSTPTPVDPSVIINDNTMANNKTWSSSKIMAEILKAVAGETTVLYDGGDSTKEDYDIIYDGGGANNPGDGGNNNGPIYDGGGSATDNPTGPSYDGGNAKG